MPGLRRPGAGICASVADGGPSPVRQAGGRARFQRADIDIGNATPQGQDFQRIDAELQRILGEAETGERMLEQRNDGDRIAGAERSFEQQLQQRALRRGGKRRAGRIVGDNAETCQLRRNAPGQIAVRRDQRRLALATIPSGFFQRKPRRAMAIAVASSRSFAASIRATSAKARAMEPGASVFCHAPQPLVAFAGARARDRICAAYLHALGALRQRFRHRSGSHAAASAAATGHIADDCVLSDRPFAGAKFRRYQPPVLFRHREGRAPAAR